MMQSKKKIKIDIIIFIIIFIVLIVFCLAPLLTKIFVITKELASKKNMLEALEKQTLALNDFQNNILIYQQNIQKIDKSFVAEEAPVEFIGFLEKLANNYGLEIVLSSVKDVSEKKSNRLTTAFQAVITGDYPVVLVFLKKLEQSPWLIKIDQVNIERVGEKSMAYSQENAKTGQVVLSLGFKAFSNYLGIIQ